MIQRIKILLFAEDIGSIPSTDMAAHSCPKLQFQGIYHPPLIAAGSQLARGMQAYM